MNWSGVEVDCRERSGVVVWVMANVMCRGWSGVEGGCRGWSGVEGECRRWSGVEWGRG